MGSIGSNLQEVKRRIEAACAAAGRSANDVSLLAVSKTFDASAVRVAAEAGQRAFGENYVQEALEKMRALTDLRATLQWHLIGPLQSNKTRAVAEAFDWVQSVDREKIAERLSAQRPPALPPLGICLQVNISGEATKSGFAPAALPEVVPRIAALPRLALRGLMAIPEPGSGAAPHRALCELAAALGLPTVSTGMSADLEDAIAAGSTLVRVGTAIFGRR